MLKITNQCALHWYYLTSGWRGGLCFVTGCQVPQWKCFHGKNYVKKDTWHHTWALKVVSIFKPSESERWLSAAFVRLYCASDTCHLPVYTNTHTHSHTPWSSVRCTDLSLAEHHVLTTVYPLQRRAGWEAEPPAEQTEVGHQLLEAPGSVRRLGTNRWSTRAHTRFHLAVNQRHWEAGILSVLRDECSGSAGCALILNSELGA